MKQRKYVKLLAVIPLVCMFSAPVSVSPISVFAAETQNEQEPAIDAAKFEKAIIMATERLPAVSQSDGSRKRYFPGHNTNPATIDVTYSLENIGTVTATEVKDITGAEDMQVATYRNDSNVEQTYQTPAKEITNTDSFTYSNTEGAKLGTSLSHTVSVNAGIPGIGGASSSTTGTVTTEFTYTHSSSNTLSRSETITFPSQTVVAAPNGTTKFINQVQRVAFSGTTENKGYVTGTIDTEQYYEYYNSKEGLWSGKWNDPRNVKEKLNIYDVFKRSEQPLPDYLELDDVNKCVILKKPIKSTFSGKLGFKSDAQVEFIPNDTSKATVRMSLADYQNPTKRMQTLQK